MNPSRVDFLVDVAYGLLIFVAVVLFMLVGDRVGIAFAIGVLLSYLIHVVWKMARFDPDWMTREVAETVAETVDETVEQTVDKEVSETVEKTVGETVEKTVGETVEKTVAETVDKEVSETVEKTVDQSVEDTVTKEVSEVIEKLEAINERVDRRPRADEVEETIEAQTEEVEGKLEEKIEQQTEEIETKLDSENTDNE